MESLFDCCKTICIDKVENPSPANRIAYKVLVKTGNTKAAGTDADVKVQLIGELGATTPTIINDLLKNDFEKGDLSEFVVEMEDIGKPLLCKLGEKLLTVCVF